MNKEEMIKKLNKYIKELNTKNIWSFSSKDIADMFKERFGVTNISPFINNCLKYLRNNNKIHKIDGEVAKYFGYIEEVYYSPLKHINDRFDYSISEDAKKYFDKLNKSTDKEASIEFSEESLFTTIIEYSTLNENNIKIRSKNIEDLEIIEKNNIENTYKLFYDNEIKTYIDKKFIKNIHSNLTRGIQNTKRMHGVSGEFANKQNFISGGYLPCDISLKEEELEKFIHFYNKKPKNINDAFIRLAIASYWFAGIHIFGDANSRTGRFLISYYMYLHGYNKKMNFAISKSLNIIGGKEIFVLNQGNSWSKKDISIYINWFINKLINESWVNLQKSKQK